MIANDLTVSVVGAGLAGSECAWQLAERGWQVKLYEMREKVQTPAHKTSDFAELVCSNSLGSTTDYSAPGQLKWEAEKLNSLILRVARQFNVPAGMALGVDRILFAKEITTILENHPRIKVIREKVSSLKDIPRPAIIATGPLTEESLANDLREHIGDKFLYFFDAIAPIIDADSIDMEIAWRADRWDKGTGDYINCPLDKEQYENLVKEIANSRKIEPKEFETTPYFAGCMPIEAIVDSGPETLRFGPASAKGLLNPKTGKRPYAVIQLRQENREATSYNIVGFQTRMAWGEQTRIFRMIPGLQNAEFLKLGSIHRNLYINATQKMNKDLSSRQDPSLFFAGQITGVEGYFESTCIGLLVAMFINQKYRDQPFNPPPRESALGSLMYALTGEEKIDFQPTNINFGLFPQLGLDEPRKVPKADRRDRKLVIAKEAFAKWLGTAY
mgnify:CR=1 FL=1